MLRSIRELRIAQGMSAEQLAVKAGTTHTTIYKVEAGGNVRVDTAVRIAKALGVTVNDLLEVPDEQQAERAID